VKATLARQVSRLLFQLEEQDIQLIILKSTPRLDLGGDEAIGPFNEGEVVTLPAWQALHLVKAGLAKFRNDEPINLAELYDCLWKEERQAALQPLPKNFLLRLRFFIEASPDDEKKKISSVFRDLMCRRLEKVVKAALRARQNMKATENMLPEEKVLYSELASNINEWLSVLHKFLNIE